MSTCSDCGGDFHRLEDHCCGCTRLQAELAALRAEAASANQAVAKIALELCADKEKLRKLRAERDVLKKDAERIDFVERHLCRSGDVFHEGALVGIMKVWQVVTQRNDTIRETIDLLREALTK